MKCYCVDDETIMDYLEGRLSKRSRGRVEEHLCICADCRDLLMLAEDLIHENEDHPPDSVPSGVTRRAIESVEAMSGDTFDWKGQLLNGGQRLLAGGRSLLDAVATGKIPQFADLRSGARRLENDFIRNRITGSGFEAIVEIEQKTDTHFTMQVKMTSKKPMDTPIRVSLFSDQHEIASASLWDEAVQFEDYPIGKYALIFSQGSRQLNVYELEI